MNKPHIVIVDDSPVNIQILMQLLALDYRLTPFSSPLEAIDFLTKHPSCDLVLLDIDMPETNGYEAFERIRRIPALYAVPIVFVTARSDVESEISAFNLGIVDYIRKPIVPALAKKRIDFSVERYLREKSLVKESDDIKQLTEVTIKTLVSLVDRFDEQSDKHIERVMSYVTLMAEYLMTHSPYQDLITPDFIASLRLSAPFHDCGKAYVSEDILCKSEKLTPEEFKAMRQQAVFGRNIIRKAREMMNRPSFYDLAEQLVLCCRERWDGCGYPAGLKGSEIPLCARIMSFADVYDTLIRKRPYKAALSPDEAALIMLDDSGKAFDPVICDAFEALRADFQEIAERMK
jgi:Response regulator containing a CheY-like receiver domain and an HD-GYP domain